MKTDYNKLMEEQIAALGGERPPLLLHACCAPCTSSVLERLYEHFRVTLYYYNPNIYPSEEYDKRLGELYKLLRASHREDVEIIEGAYDTDAYYAAARGYEAEPEGGARCIQCFDLRLSESAKKAKELGVALYCTTLSVSPHKNAALLNSIGAEKAANEGITWLYSDFKKKDGYLRSIQLCREYDIYRQCWCGCSFSLPDV